jgi:threonine/homoserine/homoserine lactone efflux protein
MAHTLFAFVAVSAIVICTPGQDTALTIRNTLAGGRRAGIATAGGVAVGQAVWTLAASLGVIALLSASEPVFRALKLAGAAYLVYLGITSIVAARSGRPHEDEVRPSSPLTPRAGLRQGVLSNLGNPKMAIFFASLLPQFTPDGRAAFAGLLALGLLFCSMTFAWLSVYAAAIDRVGHVLTGRVRRWLDAATGLVLVALGLRLATDARALADSREAMHRVEQLSALRLGLRRVAGGQRVGHAVGHVVVEDLEREALERRVDGGDLREHVDAVAILLDHPLDAAHLPLDAMQPADERVLVGGIAVSALAHATPSRVEWNRRSRSEFVTTNRLESAIAAAATIGSRSPATASGIAATL